MASSRGPNARAGGDLVSLRLAAVTDFEREFREGLGVILEEPVPSPEVGAVQFYGQWLAERNLGLVPIADAATFAWAGTWLARVRLAEGGDHTVVMDSAPSGPVFDPAGAVSRGGAIVEGWLVAPVDLGLPTAGPTARTHRLVRWLVCSSPRRQRDRWFVSTGQWRWPAGGSKETVFHGRGNLQRPWSRLPADIGAGRIAR